MDRLRAIETFIAIANRGSLTAAAAALGTSLPSVARSLAALEKHLGVRLIHRTTRRLKLTEEGLSFFQRARKAVEDLAEAEAEITAGQRKPTGLLTITAATQFGRFHVAPVLQDYLLENPGVQADLRLLDRWVDLVEEGVDLAVRIGHLEDSSLVAVQCGEVPRVLCASPAYLEEMGRPDSLSDLKRHRCIRRGGRTTGAAWSLQDRGQPVSVPIEGPLRVNQVEAAMNACRGGLGIAMFMEYQVRDLIEAGDLEVVLPANAPPILPLQVVYPVARLQPARVRGFVDVLVPHLRERFGSRSQPRTRRKDRKAR